MGSYSLHKTVSPERKLEATRARHYRDKAESALFRQYIKIALALCVAPALFFVKAISAYVVTAMGAVFLVGGVAGSVWYGRRFKNSQNREEWPTVEGRMLKSRLIKLPSKFARGTFDYLPEVQYEYTVRNKTYTGTAIRVGDDKDPLLETHRGRWAPLIERQPVGSFIRIHYNPDRPAEACLEPSESGLGVAFVTAGLVAVQGAYGLLNGLIRMGVW
ncbi:MAG: DUF3592 domain-containing protein [Nitrospirota bacterium]|nr:DUF3592 domain-containing protein [Nitrospirota bacterium]